MQYLTSARRASAPVESHANIGHAHNNRPSSPAHPSDGSVLHHAERLLWQRLQARQLDGFRFFDQMRIPPYQVDFVCLSRHVVVEVVDPGSFDPTRYRDLEDAGYHCLPFVPADIVERIDEVLTKIREALTVRL